ncbi:TetR/AcrR family transcriptional regulator [Shimia sp. MMG029]|uniref:TetR/AcrR family transcriptional regulator n=1 Tax=Shimia sp. MMG029 TaxID=3021978 RepID=UPI0022FF3E7A|nr:TetR/AcrR family transcriptional regulator [Shimia sp. MMG029]MDA5556661.1 TetR/AcrR family transcriptional regulator [Shimia sp. MMG029]
MTQRLSKQDWLQAGFDALTEAGPAALKAEPLARRLGTTKGSFYWHFDDVPGFHAALLAAWAGDATAVIAAQREEVGTAVQKLRNLAQIAAQDIAHERAGLEPAMRAWARDNVNVAAQIAAVDEARMAYITTLLSEIGLTNPELTRLLYGALLGMEALSAHDGVQNGPALGTLVDLILALHEAE